MATKTELTESEIKYATGATATEMKRWLSKGLHSCRTSADRFDARKFYLWYRDEVYRPSLGKGDEGVTLDVTAHKARYEKARAQKYMIRLQKLLENVVAIEEVEYALFELSDLFEEVCETIPKELSKLLVDQDESGILRATDEYVRKILINYSKLGEYEGEDS